MIKLTRNMIIHNVKDKMSRVDWSKVSRDDGIRKNNSKSKDYVNIMTV